MVIGKNKKGFTLIEGLVALAIFTILISVFYKVFTQTAEHLHDSKQRRAAVALANERMEHYRNMAYDNVEVTTKGGDIVADENTTVNDMTFRIITSVNLIDDPYDGTVIDGTDPIWNDYKRVSVTIVWDQCIADTYSRGVAEFGPECQTKRIRMVAQFVPPGGLEVSPSGGVLAINVLDENANVVSNAQITIYNSATDQTPYQNEPVDATGNLLYVGAPSCENCYEITVEANGYEVIKTERVPTEAEPITQETSEGTVSYNPRYVHQSVADGILTTTSFIIQKKSELNILAEDPLSSTVFSNVNFSVRGGRVLGTNLNDNPLYTIQDVYNFNEDLTTDVNGEIEIRTDTNADNVINSVDETNPGLYEFFNFDLDIDDDSTDDLIFWKMVPGIDTNSAQLSMDSDAVVDARMIFLDKYYESIFFTVVDDDGAPIENASVRVYDDQDPHIYDIEQQTDIYGHAYFPTRDENEPYDVIELISGDFYNIAVAADGYDSEIREDVDAIEIVENELIEIEIILTPSE
jgi:prepilin-type N-terminal cleavage/methylation domain-containing protein